MSESFGHGNPFVPADIMRSSFVDPMTKEMLRLGGECNDLRARLNALQADVSRREEAAYKHGLGDRAKVLDQNRLLAATIAALIDPHHPLLVR